MYSPKNFTYFGVSIILPLSYTHTQHAHIRYTYIILCRYPHIPDVQSIDHAHIHRKLYLDCVPKLIPGERVTTNYHCCTVTSELV